MKWIESIRCEDGVFWLTDYHQRRIDRTLASAGLRPRFRLEEALNSLRLPKQPGRFKLRLIYHQDICSHEFTRYQFRSVKSLRVVQDDSMEYAAKSEDRARLEALMKLRGTCDDIMIVQEGAVTDASYANLVFRKGTSWYTPEKPLLNGVMRQFLIDQEEIQERVILLSDIHFFDGCKLINAMMGMEMPEISISNIVI